MKNVRNNKGFAWLPVLIMIAGVGSYAVMAYLVWMKNQHPTYLVDLTKPPVEHVVKDASTPSTTSENNLFSFAKAKVGDRVAGMTIIEVGHYREDRPDVSPNEKVAFTGKATVTGRVTSHFGEFGGQNEVCLQDLDSTSQSAIPKLDDDAREMWFCFTNTDAALLAFPKGADATATVVIDDYVINAYPSEVRNTATYVRQVINTVDWKTYTNTKYTYSIKYPDTYVQSGTDQRIMLVHKVAAPPDNYLGGQTHAVTINVDDGVNTKGFTKSELEWFDWAKKGFSEPYPAGFLNKRQETINGQVWTLFTVASGQDSLTDYFMVKNGIVYELQDDRLGNTTDATNKDIIATFTFDETLGWKTYTNTKYGYSIQYPQDWKITIEFGEDSIQLLPPSANKKYMGGNDLAGAVTISTKAGGDVITDEKKVTINGLSAVQGKIPGIVTFTATRFTNQEGREYVIRWSQTYTDEVYNQLLSTFRFTQ